MSFILCLGPLSYADDSLAYSRAIKSLQTLDQIDFRNAVDSILESLEKTQSHRLKVYFTQQVFDITEQKDEIAHIRSLCYKASYSEFPSPELFQQARALAIKHQQDYEILYIEDRWARYFIQHKRYDSAMIHILKMKDLWPEKNRDDEYYNIVHLLGDMYFDAGLYEKADSVYSEIYDDFLQNGPLNYWRLYVVMNNRGLIKIEQEKYQEALQWFHKSYALAETNLQQGYRYNLLAYTRLKIAETHYLMEDMLLAKEYFRGIQEFPDSLIYLDVKHEIQYLKSRMLYKEDKTQDALLAARELIQDETNPDGNKALFPDIYLHVSQLHEQMQQPDSGFQYLQLYLQQTAMLNKDASIARSMIIYAEREHRSTQRELVKYRERYTNILVWMVFLVLFFVLLIVSFRLFYQKRMALLERLMDKSYKPTDAKPEKLNGIPDEKEAAKQQLLIENLQTLMKTQKPYLDPGLNIQQLAEMLSTNRTYLSASLNSVLKKSFPNFINEYRVEEAVRLILNDFTSHHTLEALAHQSGFASRSVFNAVFKKLTGVTPSFFVSNYKKKLQKDS